MGTPSGLTVHNGRTVRDELSAVDREAGAPQRAMFADHAWNVRLIHSDVDNYSRRSGAHTLTMKKRPCDRSAGRRSRVPDWVWSSFRDHAPCSRHHNACRCFRRSDHTNNRIRRVRRVRPLGPKPAGSGCTGPWGRTGPAGSGSAGPWRDLREPGGSRVLGGSQHCQQHPRVHTECPHMRDRTRARDEITVSWLARYAKIEAPGRDEVWS